MSALDPPGHHHLHHLLWECYSALVPLADEAFADTVLTPALAGTLDEISVAEGATAAELARRACKTQQAVSQLVAKLEKLGYVERRVGSGRGVELYLTAAGAAANADGIRREEQLEQRLREQLGPESFHRLREALEQARVGFAVRPLPEEVHA